MGAMVIGSGKLSFLEPPKGLSAQCLRNQCCARRAWQHYPERLVSCPRDPRMSARLGPACVLGELRQLIEDKVRIFESKKVDYNSLVIQHVHEGLFAGPSRLTSSL